MLNLPGRVFDTLPTVQPFSHHSLSFPWCFVLFWRIPPGFSWHCCVQILCLAILQHTALKLDVWQLDSCQWLLLAAFQTKKYVSERIVSFAGGIVPFQAYDVFISGLRLDGLPHLLLSHCFAIAVSFFHHIFHAATRINEVQWLSWSNGRLPHTTIVGKVTFLPSCPSCYIVWIVLIGHKGIKPLIMDGGRR